MKFYLILLLLFSSLYSCSQTYISNLYDYDSLYDLGFDVLVEDSTYVIAGLSVRLGSGWEKTFWKLDQFGNVIWVKNYSLQDPMLYPCDGRSLYPMTGGGYCHILTADDSTTNRGYIVLMRLDAFGDTIWTRKIADTVEINASEFLPLPDGGFIVCGSIKENNQVNSYDVVLLRLDSLGNIIWKKQYYSSTGNHWEVGFSVIKSLEGGYMISGTSKNFNYDVYLIETDSSGTMIWDTIIGTSGYEAGANIVVTAENGYLISGEYQPSGITNKAGGLIIKLDSTKQVVWKNIYGELLKYEVFGGNIVLLNDGSVVIAGQSEDSQGDAVGWIMKINSSGDTIWNHYYDKMGLNNESYLYDIEATDDGGFVACGFTTHFGSPENQDAWLLKVDSNGCEVMNCLLNTAIEEEIPGFKVYPNPANDILHFQSPAQRITDLRIYDISGKELLHFEPGEMHFTVPVSGLVSGIYLYRITGGNGETVTGKFVRE